MEIASETKKTRMAAIQTTVLLPVGEGGQA
jgi:hypothetical protein